MLREFWFPRFADFSNIVYLIPTSFSFFPIHIPDTPDPIIRTLKSGGATIFSTPRSLLKKKQCTEQKMLCFYLNQSKTAQLYIISSVLKCSYFTTTQCFSLTLFSSFNFFCIFPILYNKALTCTPASLLYF